ncbi:MAG: acetylglutamate kinase [Chloroflexota bacterium]|nr:acetylglutamate kinase [Chloroflexota bacterium]
MNHKPIPITVVKIGGSTLGSSDTSLRDIVAQHGKNRLYVVVHGGGSLISQWLDQLNIETKFLDGLRVTSEPALDVVISVLRGIVNTSLVTKVNSLGGRAIGLSGIDDHLFIARQTNPELGLVGTITQVRTNILTHLLSEKYIPVVAPLGIQPPNQVLNINADSAAGEIAREINADELVFMTDVDGLQDENGHTLKKADRDLIEKLTRDGVLSGGMIPKTDACLRAAEVGINARIINGTKPSALLSIESESNGTSVRWNGRS